MRVDPKSFHAIFLEKFNNLQREQKVEQRRAQDKKIADQTQAQRIEKNRRAGSDRGTQIDVYC